MAAAKNVLLFGATGLIGTHILEAVINAGSRFDRVGIYTSPGTAESKAAVLDSLRGRGVEVFVGDVGDEEKIKEAYRGFDTLISALGRNALAAQDTLIKLAASSDDIQWFFPSEYGTDVEYTPASLDEKPHQQKLKTRKYLRLLKRAMPVGGLNYTFLVTGPFAEGYLSAGPAGPEGGAFDVKNKTANLLGGDGCAHVSLTTMPDVGTLLVAALDHPKISQNCALKVNSFTTTPNGILAEFERQTGGEKWTKTFTPLDRLRDLEAKAWEEGSPAATIFTLRRIWTEGGTLYEARDNRIIGEPTVESLKDAVKRSIEGQTKG